MSAAPQAYGDPGGEPTIETTPDAGKPDSPLPRCPAPSPAP